MSAAYHKELDDVDRLKRAREEAHERAQGKLEQLKAQRASERRA